MAIEKKRCLGMCGKMRPVDSFNKVQNVDVCKSCLAKAQKERYKKEREEWVKETGIDPDTCGYCGEPIGDATYSLRLCDAHRPKVQRGENSSVCNECMFLDDCRERIKKGLALYCMIPDKVEQRRERLFEMGIDWRKHEEGSYVISGLDTYG